MYTSEGKKIVSTEKAPKAIGPYSQAIRTENLVFTAGQVGIDPVTAELAEGGIEAQTRQVITNLKHVLESAELGIELCRKDHGLSDGHARLRQYELRLCRVFPCQPPCSQHGSGVSVA